MQLYLSYNGNTVDLKANGREVLDGFYPRRSAGNATVTDQIDLWIVGSTAADRESAIRAVNQALLWAREHADGPDACYVYWSMEATGDAWRSVVVDGAIDYDEHLGRRWQHARVRCTLTVERMAYWEGPETAVPLSNGNGTDSTTGINIYNCNDGQGSSPNKYHNYVEIDGDDIIGDMPGSTRLEITNLDGTYRIYDVWIGHNWTDPAGAVQVLEAENAQGESGVDDAGCSGGKRVDKSLASGSEVTLLTWALSGAILSAARGQWVHGLIRFSSMLYEPYSWFRLKLLWNLNTIWQSDQVQPDVQRAIVIRDLFSFRLPPAMKNLSSLEGMTLTLTGEQSSGSSQNVRLDFLALVPSDGWRYISHNGYGTAQNYRIVDDGIGRSLYRDAGDGSLKAGVLTATGAPIMLYPGRDQRLYFWLHSHSTGSAPITMSAFVKIYYRPRKAGL